MSRKEKIEVIKRLVARGSLFCARVMCDDYDIKYQEVGIEA